jgi:protein-glutamine gamma-glutamyltransferase
MRFGLVHRLMTDALAVIGLLALVASGKMSSAVASVVLVGLAVALALPDRFKQQSVVRMLGTVLPLLALAAQVARLLAGADPIPVVVEFAALLQVARLATRRGAAHDHQVVLLSLLHLIAGTVLGGGLTYALALIGFLILTPGALVLSHLRREVEGNYRQGARDRTGMPVDVPRILRSRRVIGRGFLAFTCLLAVPVFLFTAFLFVLFPRVGFTWLTVPAIEPRRMVGFSDQVDLGGVGTIRSDPTLVMRVRPHDLPAEPPQRKNLYLRGALFDSYDGRTWARHGGSAEILQQFGELTILRRHPRRGTDRSMGIELEPIQPPVVFLPGDAVALRVLDGSRPYFLQSPVRQGTRGGLEYEQTKVTGLKYEVYLPPKGLVVPEVSTEQQLSRHLTIPRNLSERVRALALDMTRGQTEPVGIARALERGLREGYRYDLSSPSGAAADPLDHFLFESKRGHCEFYSTAMAMMLRVRDVPSRNVTGFVGGTYNRFGGFYAVRQGDAHSWVEAYLPDLGWTRFDPTPPSSAAPQAATEGFLVVLREMVEAAAQGWQRNVEGFDLQRQMGLARSLRDFFRSHDEPGKAGPKAQHLDWRRVGLAVAAAALIGGVLVWWLRRRRGGETTREGRALSRQRSIELYLKLEAALRARGVPRPSGTPPRTHAEALEQAGHPVGPETRALTEIYLGARYGGDELGIEAERSFRARVHALRAGQDGRAGSATSAP